MWAYESVFYQMNVLHLCGAPGENDGESGRRILRIKDWIPHIKNLGADAVFLSPVFSSDTGGYDINDYRAIDCRLGSREDFKEICRALHLAGIRVVLDGVFHQVSRNFFAFADVCRHREASPYADWFFIDFDGDNDFKDGFSYKCDKERPQLAALNLQNKDVVAYLLDSIELWIEDFGIDGLCLDAADGLDTGFLRSLRSFCDNLKPQFFLIGEVTQGDYNVRMNDTMLHSVTNFECYKDLCASFHALNLFLINRSLLRQFGPDNWSMYKGAHLLSFADNHQQSRIASLLDNENHLPLIYGMLFAMPGIPCIYYGSEWGITDEENAASHTPTIDLSALSPQWSALTDFIARLAAVKKTSDALNYGSFRSVLLTNRQCIFERKAEHERLLIAINADSAPFDAHFDAGCGFAEELLTGTMHNFKGGSILPPCSVSYWKMQN